MDEQTRVLIEVRVDRAREDIETARELFNSGRYRAAVNRSHYAIFSITTALLLTQRIERTKHAGVESAFIHLLSRQGLLRQNMEKFMIIFVKRERSRITAPESRLIRRQQKRLSMMLRHSLSV